MQMPDGSLVAREKGTPQGFNLATARELIHADAFDKWMDRKYPGQPFER